MAKPQIIKSPLSGVIEEGGVSVDVRICRLDNTGWSLEIVAEDGISTVWDDLFSDDRWKKASLIRWGGRRPQAAAQPRTAHQRRSAVSGMCTAPAFPGAWTLRGTIDYPKTYPERFTAAS
jgi:hypothetical protein